ncbi:MAG: translation initiation factor [Bdellovibrionales bacterium]
MADRKLVYSTDPKDQKKLEESRQKPVHAQSVDLSKLEVIFKLEKSGRGGKTVTVLERLPKNEAWLKDFAKELKAKCGTGGTHLVGPDFGIIEIQGDKRDQLKKILESKGIRFRGM